MSIKKGFKVTETSKIERAKIIKKTYSKESRAFVKRWQENKRLRVLLKA